MNHFKTIKHNSKIILDGVKNIIQKIPDKCKIIIDILVDNISNRISYITFDNIKKLLNMMLGILIAFIPILGLLMIDFKKIPRDQTKYDILLIWIAGCVSVCTIIALLCGAFMALIAYLISIGWGPQVGVTLLFVIFIGLIFSGG